MERELAERMEQLQREPAAARQRREPLRARPQRTRAGQRRGHHGADEQPQRELAKR